MKRTKSSLVLHAFTLQSCHWEQKVLRNPRDLALSCVITSHCLSVWHNLLEKWLWRPSLIWASNTCGNTAENFRAEKKKLRNLLVRNIYKPSHHNTPGVSFSSWFWTYKGQHKVINSTATSLGHWLPVSEKASSWRFRTGLGEIITKFGIICPEVGLRLGAVHR